MAAAAKEELEKYDAETRSIIEEEEEKFQKLADFGLTFFLVTAFGILVLSQTTLLDNHRQGHVALVVFNVFGFMAFLYAKSLCSGHKLKGMVICGYAFYAAFIFCSLTAKWPYYQVVFAVSAFFVVLIPSINQIHYHCLKMRDREKESRRLRINLGKLERELENLV